MRKNVWHLNFGESIALSRHREVPRRQRRDAEEALIVAQSPESGMNSAFSPISMQAAYRVVETLDGHHGTFSDHPR